MTGRIVCLLLLALGFASAQAQALRDPTEPPASSALAARVGDAAASEGPVLSSVILSDGRTFATIDGKTYRAGDKLGDKTVVAIASDQVTLRGAGGTQVLRLYPQAPRTTPAEPRVRSAGSKAGKS
jgi:hypothetical protein